MDIPRGKDSIGMLPTARHFEKGKTRETVKRSTRALGEGQGRRDQ